MYKIYIKKLLPRTRLLQPQRGVVLLISLIMLVIISMLAVTSMRNAGSTESILGNVRATELATQAAEIALRHCEVMARSGPIPLGVPDQWKNLATWDSASPTVTVLTLAEVGTVNTYKRPPECMVEPVAVLRISLPEEDLDTGEFTTADPVLTSASNFIITARGFGPEVAAVDGARNRPQGTEVWLQSQIELLPILE